MMVSNADISRLRSIVARELGLVFDDSNANHLAEVLRHRIRITGSGDSETYFRRVESAESGRTEIGALADGLTVGETYFFRHAAQLNAFAEVALRTRLADADGRSLHILSAGCASGEEPYSLAILAKEAISERGTADVRITGIDVSPAALARAGAARYSEWSLRCTSKAQRNQYFQRHGREYLLDHSIRSMVKFRECNLLEDDPTFWRPDEYDIIVFRNVSIYFSRATAKAVIARMTRALMPGGFLFLGPSETLRGISNDFHLLHTHDAFYYQRRRADEKAPTPAATSAGLLPLPVVPAPVVESDGSWLEAIRRAAERVKAVTERGRDTAPPKAEAGANPPAAVSSQPWDLGPALELLRQERFDEAMIALHALPPESAADADALLLRAAVLTNKGEVAEAENVCRQVLKVDELNAGAHYLLALCREHAGDRQAAAERDQTAIYLDPSFAMPHLHLGMLTQRCGDLTTAKQELQQAIVLLAQEHTARVLLFGGGFSREALMQLCQARLRKCGGLP